MKMWGILVLDDFDKQGQSQVLAYYTMPEYFMSLHDYIDSQRSWQKIDTILDVGCQLINIIKEIHYTGHTYNNMKHDNVMVEDGEITLIGFGNAKKLKPIQKQISVWKRKPIDIILSKGSKDSGFYNDLAQIYLLLISLLLKENYSAF